jgi:O-antigen/teichoic acid export membrane protein
MVPWPLRFTETRLMLAVGGTNTTQVGCTTLTARAPELVIGTAFDAASVGIYARATGLAGQLKQLLAGAVSGVFYPAFRQVRDRGDPLGPPYLKVVAAYTGITWPAMAGIAVLAPPLITMLYGERWLASAPLLGWLALAQVCYVSLPLNYDLPILLGRMRGAVARLVLETVAALILLVIAARHGLEWIAAAQLLHGLIWFALWAPMLKAMVGFAWRELALVYARSALATLAAIAPVLISYRVWNDADHAGIIQAVAASLAGVGCWFVVLLGARHPLAGEILSLARNLGSPQIDRPETAAER